MSRAHPNMLLDALNFEGKGAPADAVAAEWCGGTLREEGGVHVLDIDGVTAYPGDWIVFVLAGTYHPCPPALFNALYTPE